MDVTFHQFILFFIIFVRIATIVVTVPFFGFEAVPLHVKAGLSALLSILIFPFVDNVGVRIPTEFVPFVIMIMNEVIIGMVIGFAANILFVGVRFAGELIGLNMGLGIANIIDPLSGEEVSIIGQLEYLLAILLFLCINGHHFLIQALKLSFDIIPVTKTFYSAITVKKLISMSGEIFTVAVKVGSTTLGALFVTSFIMAILARTVPQMNIFIVGFPVTISVGFVMILVSLPFFVYIFNKFYYVFERDIIELMKII
jgi:flagellar biosynthetic protein FliR